MYAITNIEQIKTKTPNKAIKTLFFKKSLFSSKLPTVVSLIFVEGSRKSVVTDGKCAVLFNTKTVENVDENCVEYIFVEPVKVFQLIINMKPLVIVAIQMHKAFIIPNFNFFEIV